MSNDESSVTIAGASVASNRSPDWECRRQRARERRLQRHSSRKLGESFSSSSSRTINSPELSESYIKFGITPCIEAPSLDSAESSKTYLEQLPANRRLYYLASEEHRRMLLESILHGSHTTTATTSTHQKEFRGELTTSNE